ncbi:MAG TPA: HDOD domain-containing protein [Terriglobales bacterium]|jgi:putative nucleotidyltransferase with HDIG domain|nr:HDOD domain-containing protein [Terriglobales bacterium]
MTDSPREKLLRKLGALDQMPSLPVVVTQLLNYFQKPVDHQNLSEVAHLISQDESLAVRCLQLANSPLYGRYQAVETIHGAIVALGLRRMHEVAASVCLLKMTPPAASAFDPVFFWEHSMECALMSRRLAHAISFPHSDKAYLAGLLHDIGVIAHLWLVPEEFGQAFQLATRDHIPLHEAELSVLGVTHAETGKHLAERWRLGPEVTTVIAYHHEVLRVSENKVLTAIVTIADLLCRMNKMGYGFSEDRQVDLSEEPAFACLMNHCAMSNTVDWARLTFEMEGYLQEVRRLVSMFYRVPQ